MAANTPQPSGHAAPSAAEGNLRSVLARLRPYLGYILIFLAAFGVYANSIQNEYTFDDATIVAGNPRIRQLTRPGDIFGTSYWDTPQKGSEYRPLVIFSYAVNYALNSLFSGEALALKPYSYHFTNVLLHALASVLAAWVVMRLFARKYLALATGFLFALHPIHTEAVSGIVGRAEIMAAIGVFGALGAWARLRGDAEERKSALWVAIGTLSFAFGVFSKENAIALLGVIILEVVAWMRLRQLRREPLPLLATYRESALLLAGMVVVAMIYLWARTTVLGVFANAPLPDYILVDNPTYRSSVAVRIFTAIHTQGDYFWRLLFPKTLIADYSYNTYPASESLLELGVLGGLVVVIGWIVACIAGLVSAPVLGFAAGFYLITMFLTSNIPFPIGTIKAERLLYLPSFGFCLMLGWGLEQLWARWRNEQLRTLIALVFLFICLGYAARTYTRNFEWKNNFTLFQATAVTAPENVKAHVNLGIELAARGDFENGLAQINEALRIKPDYISALTNRASITAQQAQLLTSQALAAQNAKENKQAEDLRNQAQALNRKASGFYQDALKSDPSFAPAYLEYGSFLCKLGDFEHGLMLLEKLHKMSPRNIEALRQLSMQYWWAAGNPQTHEPMLKKSIQYAQMLLEIVPGDVDAKIKIGRASFELGRYEDAVKYLEQARSVRQSPMQSMTLKILGGAYYRLNNLNKAEEVFLQAQEMNPSDPEITKALEYTREAKRTGVRRGIGPTKPAASAPAAKG